MADPLLGSATVFFIGGILCPIPVDSQIDTPIQISILQKYRGIYVHCVIYTIFFSGIAGVGTFLLLTPHTSPFINPPQLLVVSDRNNNASVYNNLSATTGLASAFSELLSSSILRKTILEEIGDTSFDSTINTAAIPESSPD